MRESLKVSGCWAENIIIIHEIIGLQDQQSVPSPIAPSWKSPKTIRAASKKNNRVGNRPKWLTSKYVHAYQWHVGLRCSEPNPMLLLLNHNGARRSNSYQQALSAQSTPPRKHQLPLDHKLRTGSY